METNNITANSEMNDIIENENLADNTESNDKDMINKNLKNNINTNDRDIINKKKQDLKSVDTYLDSIKIEFTEYLNKYDSLYTDISRNTLDYFNVFNQMIEDLSKELHYNSVYLTDKFSKMNMLSNEMTQLEELYEKVREMRNGLEVVYKTIKK